MRGAILALLLAGCGSADPCGSMTVGECSVAAREATSASERLRLAVPLCEIGVASACSTLGLQLLLASENDDARRKSAYRAFRRSCSETRSYLCLYPSYVEFNRANPNVDLVVNGFEAHCEEQDPGGVCPTATAARQAFDLPISDREAASLATAMARIPDYDPHSDLRLNGTWGPQIRALPTLPVDTQGNLWSYGVDGPD